MRTMRNVSPVLVLYLVIETAFALLFLFYFYFFSHFLQTFRKYGKSSICQTIVRCHRCRLPKAPNKALVNDGSNMQKRWRNNLISPLMPIACRNLRFYYPVGRKTSIVHAGLELRVSKMLKKLMSLSHKVPFFQLC